MKKLLRYALPFAFAAAIYGCEVKRNICVDKDVESVATKVIGEPTSISKLPAEIFGNPKEKNYNKRFIANNNLYEVTVVLRGNKDSPYNFDNGDGIIVSKKLLMMQPGIKHSNDELEKIIDQSNTISECYQDRTLDGHTVDCGIINLRGAQIMCEKRYSEKDNEYHALLKEVNKILDSGKYQDIKK